MFISSYNLLLKLTFNYRIKQYKRVGVKKRINLDLEKYLGSFRSFLIGW